jgi:hypothetical protein
MESRFTIFAHDRVQMVESSEESVPIRVYRRYIDLYETTSWVPSARRSLLQAASPGSPGSRRRHHRGGERRDESSVPFSSPPGGNDREWIAGKRTYIAGNSATGLQISSPEDCS